MMATASLSMATILNNLLIHSDVKTNEGEDHQNLWRLPFDTRTLTKFWEVLTMIAMVMDAERTLKVDKCHHQERVTLTCTDAELRTSLMEVLHLSCSWTAVMMTFSVVMAPFGMRTSFSCLRNLYD